MALWKCKGGESLNKDVEFRSWHCGKARGGSLNKEVDFRFMALWKARGGKV